MFCLVLLSGMWDLHSLTWDWTHVPCSKRVESWCLGHQRSPSCFSFFLFILSKISQYPYPTSKRKFFWKDSNPKFLLEGQKPGQLWDLSKGRLCVFALQCACHMTQLSHFCQLSLDVIQINLCKDMAMQQKKLLSKHLFFWGLWTLPWGRDWVGHPQSIYILIQVTRGFILLGWPKVSFFFFSTWKNSSELFSQLNSSSKSRCQSLLDQRSLQKCNKGSQSVFSTWEAWNTRCRKAFSSD